MSNVFQLTNQQFPSMFKSPPGESSASRGGLGASPAGQKVVCTPEVSLYQYTSPDMAAVAAAAANGGGGSLQRIMEEKGIDPNTGIGANGTLSGGNNGSGGFQCGVCGKTFQQKNTFQNHLRSHREGDDPYQCDICGKTFAVPARLTRHYRTHTGEKPYQCEYCNKSFSVKENLSVHRRIHTKERPYKCEVCERAFEHSGKLHRHMRIHTGERPHRCQICQKTFIQSGQLVIHMRTHTGEKPYVCKVCGKGFTCSKQLKVHTRTHTGEKPYTCDICGKSFGYNHVLKLHQVAHYGEKVYKCTLCNGTFNSKKALETHIKTHSEDHVPIGPGSPNIVTEAGVLSPSSLSQATPPSQNSDKENRECSDSELSSQNSPSSSKDGPKTPPSPGMFPLPPVSTSSGNIVHPHHRTIQLGAAAQEHKMGGGFGRLSSSGSNTASSEGSTNSNSPNSNTSNNSQNKTCSTLPIPYPMLPPGVQIQQAPHSRTTFLYVTSKLPSHPTTMSGSNSPSSVSPPQSPPTGRSTSQHPQGNNFIGLSSNSSNNNNGNSNSVKPFSANVAEQKGVESGNNGRNKLLMHKIREKVLQFTEKYGYGLSPAEQMQQQNEKRFIESNNEGNVRYSTSSPPTSGGVSVHPVLVPENLSLTHLNNNGNSDTVMYHQNRLRHHQQQQHMKRDRSSSPEMIIPDYSNNQKTSYTPGGVLALALTKGSKAVAAAAAAANSNNNSNHLLHLHHNIPAKVSLIPVTMPNTSSSNSSSGSGLFRNYHAQLQMQHQQISRLSPRSNSPSSPVDFHHHLQLQQGQQTHQFYSQGPGSVSPARNSLHSPSPNSTPRSTPSLQEDFSDHDSQITMNKISNSGDLSSDENSSTSSNSSGMEGGSLKRSRSPNSNSSGGGPRKRSSLILEKYAMENPASPASVSPPPVASESILSQRLRLSSVIQYAEKCS